MLARQADISNAHLLLTLITSMSWGGGEGRGEGVEQEVVSVRGEAGLDWVMLSPHSTSRLFCRSTPQSARLASKKRSDKVERRLLSAGGGRAARPAGQSVLPAASPACPHTGPTASQHPV